MQRTGIRLLGKALVSFRAEKSFSAKASGLRYTEQRFLNYGRLANTEKISEGNSEKSNLLKTS